MRRFLIIMMMVAVLTGCGRKRVSRADVTVDLLLPMTPVKNQGKSELCWAYAMLATIETEHLLRGDSVNLSAVYVGRMLEDVRCKKEDVRCKKEDVRCKKDDGGGKDTKWQRAMCQTLLNIIQRYGIVPYDVLPDDATPDLPTPRWVFMLGMKYTPLEFAHSVCAPNEYLSLTCLPDSPYYRPVEVPVPDNWEHNRLLNIPLDTLKQRVERALDNRHPVCWESKGHAMAIVGKAHDKRGRAYYIMKNSWGTSEKSDGMVYMSARRMWRDMAALYMTRDAYDGKAVAQ